jgi:ketosteroid isomerase-like protein
MNAPLACSPGRRLNESRCAFRLISIFGAVSILAACAATPTREKQLLIAAEEVRGTELRFAKAMADRDFATFVSLLSPDAVFFDESNIQRGALEVAAAWKPLFSGPNAPFAWAPDHIEVLKSGNLALSTGPVTVNQKVVGRFNSTWRLDAPHQWRIVFDKGEVVCSCAGK